MNRRDFFKFTGTVAVGAVLPSWVVKAASGLEPAFVAKGGDLGPLSFIAMDCAEDGSDRLVKVFFKYKEDRFYIADVQEITSDDEIPPLVPYRPFPHA